LKDKKENKSEISSQYQKIIQDALSKQSEIKMADIAEMIKEQTGQSAQVGIVENVAKQMNEIEIIKIGRAKGIRKKGTIGTLFNQ
jgi:predicted negative regulator of RcsB-dependent stress response